VRRGIWIGGGLVVLAAAGAAAYAIYGTGGGAVSVERLAQGRQLYEANCAACHGAELEGEADWRQRRADGTLPAPPHDETGHTWHHPDQQLHAITKEGTAAFAPGDYKTNMLGFGEILNDDEIQAVLDYIKSRWPEQIRARQAEMTRRTAEAEN
jgi:mono/diheme cytochrome c family protein